MRCRSRNTWRIKACSHNCKVGDSLLLGAIQEVDKVFHRLEGLYQLFGKGLGLDFGVGERPGHDKTLQFEELDGGIAFFIPLWWSRELVFFLQTFGESLFEGPGRNNGVPFGKAIVYLLPDLVQLRRQWHPKASSGHASPRLDMHVISGGGCFLATPVQVGTHIDLIWCFVLGE